MAMSRSIGARSFTTTSPIRTWPEVIDSSPATMRKVVVLPQPEGPTSTTNSLSRMARFTSLTAWSSSNFLFKLWITTSAIALPFAGHEKILSFLVIPAEAGIQRRQHLDGALDPRLREGDESKRSVAVGSHPLTEPVTLAT